VPVYPLNFFVMLGGFMCMCPVIKSGFTLEADNVKNASTWFLFCFYSYRELFK
jgi:hypothetical protein